jgi:hypothetical protein
MGHLTDETARSMQRASDAHNVLGDVCAMSSTRDWYIADVVEKTAVLGIMYDGGTIMLK